MKIYLFKGGTIASSNVTIEVTKEEAIKIITSLANQIQFNNPNKRREESIAELHREKKKTIDVYFTIHISGDEIAKEMKDNEDMKALDMLRAIPELREKIENWEKELEISWNGATWWQ